MNYRPLGNTGLNVSEITLGTVELGMDYGFRGSIHFQKPSKQEAIRILRSAVEAGVNVIDTAGAYGSSEEIIGEALKEMACRPYIVTKVRIPAEAKYPTEFKQLTKNILGSIETSLRSLGLDTIDLILIHNTTLDVLERDEIFSCLEATRQQGKIRLIGASTYEEEVSLRVLEKDLFRVLQVPFNLLDQKLRNRVFPKAVEHKVGLFVRSAFLRGVLTDRVNFIPDRLAPLKKRAYRALEILGEDLSHLSDVALRFCLSFGDISSVLIGVRSSAELKRNLHAANRGPYPEEILERLRAFSLDDEELVNPTNWQDLI